MQVFYNGVFISCDEKDSVYSYMVEDKGKIVFLGNELPEIYRRVPDKIDLQGKAVTPAYADTHIHFGSFALFHFGLNFTRARNLADIEKITAAYIKDHPKEQFLFGFGISKHTIEEKRDLTRHDLDMMTDTPMLIVKYDGHAALANTALIKLFQPEVRESPGFDEKSGWLYLDSYYQGVNFVSSFVKPLSLLNSLIKASNYMARQGINLIHAAEGNGFKNDADFDAVRRITRAFPQHFRLFFQTMDVAKVKKRKLNRLGGCFVTALDGCFGSEDAALLEPYSNNPENKGKLFYSQKEVNDFMCQANRENLQIAVHAIGDAAFEQAVTGFETAFKDFPRDDHRHIIIHADLVPSHLLEKAGKLGLCFAVQPSFLYWEQEPASYLEEILGDRAQRLIPLRDMLQSGVVIAGGSDAPCTMPHPWEGISAAVNHPNAGQRLTLREALKMYTSWAACLSFDENRLGALKTGYKADFVVLNQNPFAVPEEKLSAVKPEQVYFAGQLFDGVKVNLFDIVFKMLAGKGEK
ncbi:amidohydrolase [Thermosyntropha sp.]|uniref:amidohydrolase n=1 Tax=Thermosyntropha sp. TaxID=2740820 RepID=UPI0025FBAE36|nr:amidohydrolase [Thermosyntropha sp.]MBO8159718.1 amidohydrolase [Thermosyntropha sp.]